MNIEDSVAGTSMGEPTTGLVHKGRNCRSEDWMMVGLANRVGMNQSKDLVGEAFAEKNGAVADSGGWNAPKAWHWSSLSHLKPADSELLGNSATALDTGSTWYYGDVVLAWQRAALLALPAPPEGESFLQL